jgi:hypothetical protein
MIKGPAGQRKTIKKLSKKKPELILNCKGRNIVFNPHEAFKTEKPVSSPDKST